MQRPHSILFTQKGYDELVDKLKRLETERPEAVSELSKARAMGDLSENGYYKSARAKLSEIDRTIRHTKYLIQHAKVSQVMQTDYVDINSTVTITDGTTERTYTIVGGYESNPSEGKISIHSPLGKALSGKRLGETAIFPTPSGEKKYVILQLS